jgi:hypothetical protein
MEPYLRNCGAMGCHAIVLRQPEATRDVRGWRNTMTAGAGTYIERVET